MVELNPAKVTLSVRGKHLRQRPAEERCFGSIPQHDDLMYRNEDDKVVM